MELEHPHQAGAGASVDNAAAARRSAANLDRARDWHGSGRLDDAAREYEAVLVREPDNAHALHLYGVLEYQRGAAAKAESLIRRSISLGASARALSDLGAILASAARTDEALEQFEAALRIDSQDVQALVRKGNTLLAARRYEAALETFDRALEISPLTLDALCNRGSALRALQRYQEALESYERALTVDPRSFESFYNLGNVLRDLQRYARALHNYERALEIAPNHPEILSVRGLTLVDLGRVKEALASFNEAIATRPDFVEALYNSAVALERLGRSQESMQRCDRVLALDSRHSKARATRGNALLSLQRYEEALSEYARALEMEPGATDVLCNQGTALHRLQRYEAALYSYDAALAANQEFAEAWCNRGNVLQDMHRYEDALQSFDRAISINPKYAIAWFNRGSVLLEMLRFDEALEAFDRAIACDPNYSDAHFAQGFIYLRQGDLARGWPKYEWRLRDPKSEHNERIFSQPRWTGVEPLDGRTLLVHAEQGFGDTVQFCRYAQQLRDAGARVVLEVQPALRSLMASLQGPAQVIARGEPLPAFDYHCPLLSLPYAFQTDLSSIPGSTPYLHADPALVEKWAGMLGLRHRPRVGLAWSGNPEHRNDRNRSIEFATLLPLLRPDIDWISLQKVVRDRDAALLDAAPVRTFDTDIRDFSDTAAIMQSLDLIISVDTAVAHLAGALNRPVWILVTHLSEWRWMSEREDSPWYPSARVFRQPAPGRWADVVEQVQAAIARWI
ncbi:tetratricopeptide repeat protein [Paraburkholderia kururiensis]|uniref:Tetratricopeptide repeat protein n=1 Tax=Paraburkholderia kururiensis TaxID=984307 RepID=A0ABZ0WR96_9BURK|nr:tetratricopeptide repeat protein [Paraburkholderia kururiensis]WQD79935.1 tetratricopeptide repeat protein [Paraburkholderia kururiensis]